MNGFSTGIPQRTEVIRAYKAGGGRVAAVLPIHYPRALFRAFEILPVEVWGPARVDNSYGAAHLQSYICSIARNALSFLLAGGLDAADMICVPHACDSLQGLGSILIDFIRPGQPVLPFYLPRGYRESDHQFLADELVQLYRCLEAITGRSPDEAQLMEGIHREEQADRLLAELHQRRSFLPLSQADFYRFIRSREFLPAESFISLAQDILSEARPMPQTAGIPFLLSGIVLEPMGLLDAIETMGGRIAADDLACCGRRLYPPGKSEDPFRRMAESFLSAPPDPTRGSPISERIEHLLRLSRSAGARGIVFYEVKFCEPESFDLPILRKELQDEGFRSLVIEVDMSDSLSQQVLTRLEAFLETIS